ncbi:MAG: ATP-binding cassette domain-containing protein [Alphaproteobacteria bacterium]|nr:ATP-binding cassette domain-containing protein [Alphaproteobacteria bacterium]
MRFGDQTVHDGLNLDVRRGEILCVVGASGSGKSVLMREIVGLQKPTSGTINVAGVDMDDSADRARKIGVMFQDGALFSTMTVRENVEAPLKEHADLPPQLVAELADLKLVMAGLEPQAHHKKPSELSGGMRKRAALARALALDPGILFLDEPTAGLDPVAAQRFDTLIVELHEAMALTVLIVTHDVDTLEATADRVCVLYGGKVLTIGPLDEVRRFKHPWVQDYFSGPRARQALAAAR